MKTWDAKYYGNNIHIENEVLTERLFINGKLHDETKGDGTRAKLIGRLPDGRLVKVSLGGFWTIHCTIFVEDEKIMDYQK